MNQKCSICQGMLQVCKINHFYYECVECNSQFMKDSSLNLEVLDHYFVNIEKGLEIDKRHYDRMMKKLTTFAIFAKIMEFDAIYCVGGGFPKLESYLRTPRIKVFDLAAEHYARHVSLFKKVYDCTSHISYQKHVVNENTNFSEDILNKITPETNNLVTFVHFWEHLTPNIFHNMLDHIENMRRDTLGYLVYQPDPAVARDSSWFHYGGQDHITLITSSTMRKLLKERGFDVIYSETYADDMLHIFY